MQANHVENISYDGFRLLDRNAAGLHPPFLNPGVNPLIIPLG